MIVPAHSFILKLRSPVFAAMMLSGMAEQQSGQIVIEDADADIFPQLLEFIYCGRVELNVTNAVHLLYLSTKYQLAGLQQDAERFIGRACRQIDQHGCIIQ